MRGLTVDDTGGVSLFVGGRECRMAALERRRCHQGMLLFQRLLFIRSLKKGTLPKLITFNGRYLEGIIIRCSMIKMT